MTRDNDDEAHSAGANPCKILVVDDEPDLERLVLQRMRREIRRRQYAFEFAHNGVEALELLSQDRGIDIVLSDINMPQMDGLTLLEKIPSVDPDICSVIISAYGDMKNIRTAMNRGAFDFITKPIDFEDLRVTIERTLRHLIAWREAVESRDKLIVLQSDLEVARKMQQSILPAAFPESPDYQVFASMEPARAVGGDFFDVVHLDKGRIGLAIADVSGKGVPGAVLREVNRLLHEDNEATMFVTVFYGVFDPTSRTLVYANGGHNPPLVVHADGTSTELPLTDGIALGLMPDLDYREGTVDLAPGDAVVFYTDGVTEAENDKSELFGVERLRHVFEDSPPRDAENASMAVFEAVNSFAGDTPQSDDVTCLTLYRAGADG